jgi:hypothetical protein
MTKILSTNRIIFRLLGFCASAPLFGPVRARSPRSYHLCESFRESLPRKNSRAAPRYVRRYSDMLINHASAHVARICFRIFEFSGA